jgi:hypothetical protein
MKWKNIDKIAKSPVVKAPKLDPNKVLDLIQQGITNAKQMQVRSDGAMTFKRHRDIVGGYRQLLDTIGATHFLTFMPTRRVKPETLAKNVTRFFQRLERKSLRRYWYKFTENRVVAVGFLEKPDTNPHYHVIASIPLVSQAALDEYSEEIWHKLMPAGTLDVQRIRGNARRYVSKDLHHYWAAENVLIYQAIPK